MGRLVNQSLKQAVSPYAPKQPLMFARISEFLWVRNYKRNVIRSTFITVNTLDPIPIQRRLMGYFSELRIDAAETTVYHLRTSA